MLFDIVLVAAALACGLVSGLLLLSRWWRCRGSPPWARRDFVRAVQVMDRVNQGRQPVFMVTWVGSVLAVLAALLLGLAELAGVWRWLLVAATAVYLLGVQLPTAVVNIPVNNRVQRLDVATVTESEVTAERKRFERRWNRWNALQTACGVSAPRCCWSCSSGARTS